MKKIKLFIICILVTLFSSCVSIKPGKNINRAENKIIKYNKGIQNQINRYPELSNVKTIIEKDSIKLPSDTIFLNLPVHNLYKIDSLTNLLDSTNQLNIVIIDSILMNTEYITDTIIKTKLITNLDNLKKNQNQIDSLILLTTENLLFESKGVIDLVQYKVNYLLLGGNLELEVITQEEYITYEKSKITNNIDIRKDFWQDKKFYWLFCLPLLFILFFFGKGIQDGLQEGLSYILKLIRKLIFKV